jgi:ATP-binding cassette subfamily C (CFTR/MRP) protein 1
MLDPLPSCSQSVVIDGVGLHSIARTDVRERIIAMSQDPVFLPGEVSIKKQLDPFNLSALDECYSVLQLVGLDSLAPESVGLEVGLRPDSLSGGQRQLFSLARTILRGRARTRGRYPGTQSHENEKVGGILLLDEVSASVDKQTEQTMHRIIMDEFVDYTIIMVAHHLDAVMDFDTVLVMEQGRVVERGQPKVLAAEENSHFGRLWTAGRNA